MTGGGTGRRPDAVRILAGQGVAMGLVSGFLIIPTAGIFLAAYGSSGLPWVYLAVAAVGGALVPVMARVLDRWPLHRVATGVTGTIAVALLGAWIGLEAGGGSWISFVLEVLFPMVLQFGFLLLGAQAGRLLTLREMKERFVRIVFGFVIGFFLAGLAAGPLLSVMGETHRLLALGSAAAVVWCALAARTGAAFASSFAVERSSGSAAPRVPLTRLLQRPIVLVLLAYQLLSVLGTQLVEYLVYDRAAARYSSSTDLARFTSVFTVILNLFDIVFVAFVAAALLRRYGMRLGLVANPATILVLLVGAVVLGAAGDIGSISVFFTVGAARVLDISLTDGATRGAINTAYQALPPPERLAAQNAVEGIGQPAAIGLTGVLLLVIEHVFHAGASTVLALAVGIAAVWTLAGVAAYRSYRGRLRDTLAERLLHPVPASTPDPETALAAEIAVGLADPDLDLDERALVRLIRRCPRVDDPGLAAAIAAAVPVRGRDVGLELVRALAKCAPAGAAERVAVCEQVVSADAEDLRRVLDAMSALEERPGAAPLLAALDDERRLLRDRTIGAIALVADPGAVSRAGRWLAEGDARAVATALETLELLLPHRLRQRGVALLNASAEPSVQRAALAGSSPRPRAGDAAATLRGLADHGDTDATAAWTARVALSLG